MKPTRYSRANGAARALITLCSFLAAITMHAQKTIDNRRELSQAHHPLPQDSIPCIYLQNPHFDELSPGESDTRDLIIWNKGTGQLTFQAPFLTWSGSAFSISSHDIDRLKAARLGPGEGLIIHVNFESDSIGSFRSVARFWTNPRDGRDTSVWAANVIHPGPFISGYEWGKVWVTTRNAYTKNADSAYSTNLYIINTGFIDYTVTKIELVGKDAGDGYFQLDSKSWQSIHAGDFIYAGNIRMNMLAQRVFFKPKEERDYECTIRLITAEGDTVQNHLRGTGIESHLTVGNFSFGNIKFREPPGSLARGKLTITAPNSTRDITITNVRVDNPDFKLKYLMRLDAESISLRPATLFTLRNGEQITVYFEFTPQTAEPRVKIGHIIFSGDFSRGDDSVGTLSATLTTAEVPEEPAAPSIIDRIEPNPFSSSTKISFRTERRGHTTVEIYDQAGKLIESLADGDFDSGAHTLLWSPADIPSGVYYCRIRSGERESTQPVLLIR